MKSTVKLIILLLIIAALVILAVWGYRSYSDTGEKTVFRTDQLARAELMRTRYCIRHELGLCPKLRNRSGQADGRAAATDKAKSGTDAAPLYLLNNGQRFTVLFDCRSCEMVIK